MNEIEAQLHKLTVTDNDSASPELHWKFSVTLSKTHEVVVLQLASPFPETQTAFKFAKQYEVATVLSTCHVPPQGSGICLEFVCLNTSNENKALETRRLFRESFLIVVKTVSGETFDLHLSVRDKPSNQISGILLRRSEYQISVGEHMNRVIRSRKIDLVLDIDDTLLRVRKKGNADENRQLSKLDNGMAVELAEDLWKFLDFLSKHCMIHLYSAGDASYVKSVANLLNKKKLQVTGKLFSGNLDAKVPGRPPKSLSRLFPHETRSMCPPGMYLIHAVIIDDIPEVWDYQDRMSVVVRI
ncbi:hypothetical protein BDR26DRAFT_852439 [Obelidium mucronatum]|nr:hypothetical protein BDR26DRAFT_852439 [Obelidium mucronatum]